MNSAPPEILRAIGAHLNIKSICNLSQASTQLYSSLPWLWLLKDQAIKLYPLLGLVNPDPWDWKKVALLAYDANNRDNINKGGINSTSVANFEKFLALHGVRTGSAHPEQQTSLHITDETITNCLKELPQLVNSSGWNNSQYRATVLYWICFKAKPNTPIFNTTLEVLLKDANMVNIPALADDGKIDWPIFAAVAKFWIEGAKRLMQIETIDLNITTNNVHERVLQMSPIQIIILKVTNRQLLKDYKMFEHGENIPASALSLRQQGYDMIKLLLARANPNQATGVIQNAGRLFNTLLTNDIGAEETGVTALHIACYYQVFGTWIDAIKILIESGADVNAQTSRSKLTPLHMLFANIFNIQTRNHGYSWSANLEFANLKAVVELFLDHGADLSLTTTDGMNIIHYAYVARNFMKFDDSIITLMIQHCPQASISLPWTVCLQCKQRYQNGDHNTACQGLNTNNDNSLPRSIKNRLIPGQCKPPDRSIIPVMEIKEDPDHASNKYMQIWLQLKAFKIY